MPPAQYVASRATQWSASAVLFTNDEGLILVEDLDYRPTALLPGGAIEAGEPPSVAATREVDEEIGLQGEFPRVLVVDWVPPRPAPDDPQVIFPEETIYVRDGGTLTAEQIRAIRLPGREVTGIRLVEPAELHHHMTPGHARRTLAALRARINAAGAAVLEDGYPTVPTVLDELRVLSTPRTPQRWAWHPGQEPAGTPVECSAWLFWPDGRVLLRVHRGTGAVSLPGTALEPQDTSDPQATLIRHTRQNGITLGPDAPVYLGHLRGDTASGATSCTRIRMAAAIAPLRPTAGLAGLHRAYAHVLATPEQVLQMVDWGPDGPRQLAAVQAARAELGLPTPAPQPVTTLPADAGARNSRTRHPTIRKEMR